MSSETPDELTAGEAYYRAYGWSGCAGSAWDRLSPATRDGWNVAAAERERADAAERKASDLFDAAIQAKRRAAAAEQARAEVEAKVRAVVARFDRAAEIEVAHDPHDLYRRMAYQNAAAAVRAALSDAAAPETETVDSITDIPAIADELAREAVARDARVAAERERADAAALLALAAEIADGRVQRPGMQRRRQWADRIRAALGGERERADAAEAKIAAAEALAEEATQRAYMQIARDRMLTVMPIDPARTRAVVPDHWRAEAEEAASVPVTDLRAALGGEATP